MKKCLLVINPRSGKMKIQYELLSIIKLLNKNDYMVDVQLTLYHNHAREIPLFVKNNNLFYDLIICSGGDGTLNQVVSGLIESGLEIPLGYIPSGSTNDYANTLGLSFDMLDATNNILMGDNYLLEVGLLNNHNYFNQYFAICIIR